MSKKQTPISSGELMKLVYLICFISPFALLIIIAMYSQPQKKAHTLTNEQIMIIYRQGYLNGYNARDLTYEQFKLRMTADSLKMVDLMR